jgi:hypothetical protein
VNVIDALTELSARLADTASSLAAQVSQAADAGSRAALEPLPELPGQLPLAAA